VIWSVVRAHAIVGRVTHDDEHLGDAVGVVGDVTVELFGDDEDDTCRLQLDIGQFSCGCTAVSPGVLRSMSEFFAETFRTGRFLDSKVDPGEPGGFRPMPSKQLVLGTIAGHELLLCKDGKYDDRYFLMLGVSNGYSIYVPTLAQTERLIDAVSQALGSGDG
jgi:hypothetical protein